LVSGLFNVSRGQNYSADNKQSETSSLYSLQTTISQLSPIFLAIPTADSLFFSG